MKKICFFSFLVLLITLFSLFLYSCAQEYVDADGIVYKRCIDGYAVMGEENGSVDVVIPDTFQGKAVVEISKNAFADRVDISSVILGKNVKRIGDRAFQSCQRLKRLELPSSLERIGENAIDARTIDVINYHGTPEEWLKRFDRFLPTSFDGEPLEELIIPDFMTEIPDFTFQYARLKSVVIPDTVTSIGMNAFQFSTIQRAVIGNGVKTVGAFAFNQSELQSVVIGSSVETIGENAFWGTELDCVFIPSSVTGMAANSFDFPSGNWQSIKIFAAAESCPVTWDVVWETKKNDVVWGATQADCDQYQVSLPSKKS